MRRQQLRYTGVQYYFVSVSSVEKLFFIEKKKRKEKNCSNYFTCLLHIELKLKRKSLKTNMTIFFLPNHASLTPRRREASSRRRLLLQKAGVMLKIG